ncbi:hypothetical protein J5X84_43800 [Streptosporangiaceae bacterium NEAU-GS5]|nr:hypothetical protein [Streptosporangiaceae bacterium NEAU-GS5]
MMDKGAGHPGWGWIAAILLCAALTVAGVIVGWEVAGALAGVLALGAAVVPLIGTHGEGRRQFSRVQIVTAVVAMVAMVVAGVVIKRAMPGTSDDAACPEPGDPVSRPQVHASSVAKYPGLTMRSLAYRITERPELFLETTGRVEGEVPSGNVLYVMDWADPGTEDSTPDRYHGTGRFEPWRGVSVRLDQNGCWSLPAHQLGYSGAQGLTFRIYLGTAPAESFACLENVNSKHPGDGFDDKEFESCNVALLGYAEIPTHPL